MELEFIQDLFEGRMLRNESNAKALTYEDCCERLYLTVLMIEALRQFPKYEIVSKAYANDTTKYTNYKVFRGNATDLYNLIYLVTGDESAIQKLKNPEKAEKLRSKTTLPTMALNGYLSQVAVGKQPLGHSGLFMRLETSMNINNSTYKEIRRAVANINSLNGDARKSAVSKLVSAGRSKLRNSDLLKDLEALLADKDLEVMQISQPKTSLPDVSMTGTELALYKYLVGSENVVYAKRFVDLVKDGQSIPSSVVKGYSPIIKMIDDIVKGGPTYLNQLRALHQRAKKGH